MPGAAGSVGQDRREPLDPPVDGDVVDLYSALGKQLLDIAIGQAVTEVPAYCEHDHLPGKPEAGLGGRTGRTRRMRRMS